MARRSTHRVRPLANAAALRLMQSTVRTLAPRPISDEQVRLLLANPLTKSEAARLAYAKPEAAVPAIARALARWKTPPEHAARADEERLRARIAKLLDSPRARLDLKEITVEDAEYQEQLELRYRVLREPLGFRRDQVKFPFEKESLHLVALDANQMVGTVSFLPMPHGRGRLYQMAVAFERQGEGIGARLVRELEHVASQRRFREIILHARGYAVPFYRRLDYRIYGDAFAEVGIPHRHMKKRLTG